MLRYTIICLKGCHEFLTELVSLLYKAKLKGVSGVLKLMQCISFQASIYL